MGAGQDGDAHLLPASGALKLDEITDDKIAALQAALANRNPKTVNNVLSTLSILLKTAVRWKLVERMPCTIEPLKAPSKAAEFSSSTSSKRW
jgi:hypothetical protein